MKKGIILIALSPITIASGVETKNKLPNKPNVVLIVADDLGIGDVSCYGTSKINTPAIDSLASNGIRFSNGYATSATSTPSRLAMFTGMYPWKNPEGQDIAGRCSSSN